MQDWSRKRLAAISRAAVIPVAVACVTPHVVAVQMVVLCMVPLLYFVLNLAVGVQGQVSGLADSHRQDDLALADDLG